MKIAFNFPGRYSLRLRLVKFWKPYSLHFFYLAILLGFLIRLFIILNGIEIADVQRMHEVGNVVLQGDNPYLYPNFYIYPPIWMYVSAGNILLSKNTGIPFNVLIKTLPAIADIAITGIVFLILKHKYRRGFVWPLVYLFNPISIIISSSHGQFDSLVLFFSLTALYPIILNKHRLYLMSALSLGLAIALKLYPILLLPFFIMSLKSTKNRVLYILFAILPLLLTLAPFVAINPSLVITNIFGYSGVYDFGFAAVFRGLWYNKIHSFWLPGTIGQTFAQNSKLTFLLLLMLIWFLFATRRNLIKLCLIVYLLFITTYSSISAQYYTWILPFAVLSREKMIVIFSFAVTMAYAGFYMIFWPGILLGNYKIEPPFQDKYLFLYLWGNIAIWVVSLFWIIKLYFQLKISNQNYKIYNPLQIFFRKDLNSKFIILPKKKLAAILILLLVYSFIETIETVFLMVKALM